MAAAASIALGQLSSRAALKIPNRASKPPSSRQLASVRVQAAADGKSSEASDDVSTSGRVVHTAVRVGVAAVASAAVAFPAVRTGSNARRRNRKPFVLDRGADRSGRSTDRARRIENASKSSSFGRCCFLRV